MKPWYIREQQAFQELKRQIESKYATLRVFVENDTVYIRGGLAIKGLDGRELDHYLIEIQIPDNYPKSMPIVKEMGGRLPKVSDRHFSSDGTACLFLAEERYKYYPQNSTIIDFIDGPVKNFFLWQTDYDLNHGKPSFEGRGHGVNGIIEFYSEQLKTNNISIIYKFVDYLSAKKIKMNRKCYCGSGKKLKDCHLVKLQDLRAKIARGVVKTSLNQIKVEKLKQNNIRPNIPNL